MDKLIVISHFPDQGGSFLNWSLHYLSGQKVHYGLMGDVCEVCKDPLQGDTAHGFPRNLLRGKFLSKKLRKIEQLSVPGIRSVIVHPRRRSISHFHSWLNAVRARGHEVIYILGPNDWEWRFGTRFRGGVVKNSHDYMEVRDRMLASSQDRGSMLRWVSTPGRLREYLALFFESPRRPMYTTPTRDFRMIEFERWLGLTEESLLELMGDLGLRVCEDRLSWWRSVAVRWRKIVRCRLTEWDVWWHSLVDAVVCGKDHDCGGLNMMQEGMLVRDVLRSCGGMIRARHLDHLPTNAREIHQLIR